MSGILDHDDFAAALGRYVQERLKDKALTTERDVAIFQAGYLAGFEYGKQS